MQLRSGKFTTAILATAVAFVAAACAGGTEQSKECTGGGTADEAVFAQHFSQMGFDSGLPATGEGGQEFAPSESVVLAVGAKGEVAIRFCAQKRSRTGDVAYDQEHSLPAGESRVNLGTFQEKGDYVVRASVGGLLVKNLAFTIR